MLAVDYDLIRHAVRAHSTAAEHTGDRAENLRHPDRFEGNPRKDVREQIRCRVTGPGTEQRSHDHADESRRRDRNADRREGERKMHWFGFRPVD